jgi:hypothetical protein
MTKPVDYTLYTSNGDRFITINPVTEPTTGGHIQATGVFGLNEGMVDLGDIVFDDNMKKLQVLSKTIMSLTPKTGRLTSIAYCNYG